MAMAEAGISEKEALKRVYMVDSRGLIVKVNLIDYAYVKMRLLTFLLFHVHVHALCLFQNRPSGGVTGPKIRFAQEHAPVDKLVDVVKLVKPTAIIGKHRRST